MEVSSSTTASRTVKCTTTSAGAPSALAARSPSQDAASRPCPRSSTLSILCAPSAWNSSTKEPSKNRTTNPTATAASSNCSVRESEQQMPLGQCLQLFSTARVGAGWWIVSKKVVFVSDDDDFGSVYGSGMCVWWKGTSLMKIHSTFTDYEDHD